jgi:hypothetical protein
VTIDEDRSRLHQLCSLGSGVPQEPSEGYVESLTAEAIGDRNKSRAHDQVVGPLKGTLRSAKMTISTPEPTMHESATLKIA